MSQREREIISELQADVRRLREVLALLSSQASGYADLLEDAAKHMPKEFDAGLLRGLADVLRELNPERLSKG